MGLLDKLVESMEEEVELCERLIHYLKEEKDAVIHADVEKLNRICGEKEKHFHRIRKLGEKRNALQKEISVSFGSGAMGIEGIARNTEPRFSKRLMEYRDRLLSLSDTIRDANKTNGALLGNALEMIQGSMDLLTMLTEKGQTYHKSGRIQAVHDRGKHVSRKL